MQAVNQRPLSLENLVIAHYSFWVLKPTQTLIHCVLRELIMCSKDKCSLLLYHFSVEDGQFEQNGPFEL